MPELAQNGLSNPERPATGRRAVGPANTPTHPLATAPVGSPVFSVDGFVKEFIHELNTNQGVPRPVPA